MKRWVTEVKVLNFLIIQALLFAVTVGTIRLLDAFIENWNQMCLEIVSLASLDENWNMERGIIIRNFWLDLIIFLL